MLVAEYARDLDECVNTSKTTPACSAVNRDNKTTSRTAAPPAAAYKILLHLAPMYTGLLDAAAATRTNMNSNSAPGGTGTAPTGMPFLLRAFANLQLNTASDAPHPAPLRLEPINDAKEQQNLMSSTAASSSTARSSFPPIFTNVETSDLNAAVLDLSEKTFVASSSPALVAGTSAVVPEGGARMTIPLLSTNSQQAGAFLGIAPAASSDAKPCSLLRPCKNPLSCSTPEINAKPTQRAGDETCILLLKNFPVLQQHDDHFADVCEDHVDVREKTKSSSVVAGAAEVVQAGCTSGKVMLNQDQEDGARVDDQSRMNQQPSALTLALHSESFGDAYVMDNWYTNSFLKLLTFLFSQLPFPPEDLDHAAAALAGDQSSAEAPNPGKNSGRAAETDIMESKSVSGGERDRNRSREVEVLVEADEQATSSSSAANAARQKGVDVDVPEEEINDMSLTGDRFMPSRRLRVREVVQQQHGDERKKDLVPCEKAQKTTSPTVRRCSRVGKQAKAEKISGSPSNCSALRCSSPPVSPRPRELFAKPVVCNRRKFFSDSEYWVGEALRRVCLCGIPDLLDCVFYPHMRFLYYDKVSSSVPAHVDLSRTDQNGQTSTHTFILYLNSCGGDRDQEEQRGEQTSSTSSAASSARTLSHLLRDSQEEAQDSTSSKEQLKALTSSTPPPAAPAEQFSTPAYPTKTSQLTQLVDNTTVPNSPNGGETVLLDQLPGPKNQYRIHVQHKVRPRPGRLFLFPHACPHQGNPVWKPTKLLLRGEVKLIFRERTSKPDEQGNKTCPEPAPCPRASCGAAPSVDELQEAGFTASPDEKTSLEDEVEEGLELGASAVTPIGNCSKNETNINHVDRPEVDPAIRDELCQRQRIVIVTEAVDVYSAMATKNIAALGGS
ncbi:unnamed protein product [Amoebophrya sp. A120]|nr:unnamed protein product [Amoebophrya sp. A120]|eukprot:GSA120T00011161001.1